MISQLPEQGLPVVPELPRQHLPQDPYVPVLPPEPVVSPPITAGIVTVRKVIKDKNTGTIYWEDRNEILGRGGFGKVHEVVDILGERLALKMPKEKVDKDKATDTADEEIIKEIEFLHHVQGHDNVAKFFDPVEDAAGKGPLFKL
ncbi:hypothetical protein BGX33_011197 [Mortierella sp. NVP41]|nr:hypothetical protein BGX33_011197 [Mortierella sp. NVP41]